MQIITSNAELKKIVDNSVLGNFDLCNSKIIFKGTGNILATSAIGDAPVKLNNTIITFKGNNAAIFLAPSKRNFVLDLRISNDSYCYIGGNNYFSNRLNLFCTEHTNAIIGDDSLFSFGVWIRTSDVHLLYDCKTKKRINNSKSIFIGDHIWISQNATVLKGTKIGSGATLGANAVVADKKVLSNSVWVGNPAKLIKSGVFSLGTSSHDFTNEEIEKFSQFESDDYVFQYVENETLNFEQIDSELNLLGTAYKKIEYLLKLNKIKTKNRFSLF
ncbi:MAG: acyltransferase [Oscillospiraceae bacterium]|jgi:acetyltransferase-like isoleucine patch superfamily enzyme|nr:acyltransferase [Oscillospiraceae bacterium]